MVTASVPVVSAALAGKAGMAQIAMRQRDKPSNNEMCFFMCVLLFVKFKSFLFFVLTECILPHPFLKCVIVWTSYEIFCRTVFVPEIIYHKNEGIDDFI